MTAVTLHVYDVSTNTRIGKMNEFLEALGTGAYHGAVEVNGVEWSYGYNPDGTGVFACRPKGCSMHHYRESVSMGETQMSKKEINDLILKLKASWPGFEYDLLRHNCVLFSSFFCEQLGVGAIPDWVKNLCGAGEKILDSGAATAAKAVLEKAGKFDEEYQVREKAFAAAAKAAARAHKAKEHADADGDGHVSADELKEYFRTKAQKTPEVLQAKAWEFAEGAKAMADAIQEAADKDGDGKLSFQEAVEFMHGKIKKYAEKAKEKAALHHAAADANHDGRVSMEEGATYATTKAVPAWSEVLWKGAYPEDVAILRPALNAARFVNGDE